MKPEIKYLELKSDYEDNGPAWIGLVSFSKSGKTLYFDNKAFQSLHGSTKYSNYFDVETGDEYWISNPKKNLGDRHYLGSGVIAVEKRILQDYLQLVGKTALPKTGYKLVDVDTNIPKKRINEMENEVLAPSEIDPQIYHKTAAELSVKELEFLIDDLIKDEENAMYNKGRRSIKRERLELEQELEKRQ